MSYQTLVQSDRIAYSVQQGATLNQIAIITADIPSRSTIYFANSNIFRQDGTLDTSQAVLAIDVYGKTVRVGDYYISSGSGVTGAQLISTTNGLISGGGPLGILQLASTAIGVNDQSYHYNFALLSTIAGQYTTFAPQLQTGLSTLALFTSNTSNYYSNNLVDYSTPISSISASVTATSNYLKNLSPDISTPVSSLSTSIGQTSNWSRGILQNWSTPISTVAAYTSNTSNWAANIQQNWSSAVSTATLYTSNTSNWARSAQQDWSTPVSTVALYASNTSNWAANLSQNWSSAVSIATLYTSNTSNYYKNTVQDYSTAVSSVAAYTSTTSNYFIANAGGSGTSSLLGVISSGFSTLAIFTSNTSNWSRGLIQDWSTAVSSVSTLNAATSNYFLPAISNNYSSLLLSTVVGLTQGLGSAGYISSGHLASTVLTLTSNISSMIDPVELASTIVGLGTVGFISSIGLTAIMNSTVAGVNLYVSSMIDPVELTSSILGLGSQGFISSVGLDARLASTLLGVSTQIAPVYQYSRGALQDWSTPVSTVAAFTSNTSNWTKNLQQDISTPISSLSTTYGYVFTSLSAAVSTLTLQNFTAAVGSVSSLQVNALTIGSGTGIISLGDINTVSISSISTTAGAFYGITVSVQQITASSFKGDGSQLQNVAGLSTVYFYSRNLLQDFSTGNSSVAAFTSNTSNWSRGVLQDWSTSLSTVALYTSNTSNWASNIQQNWSSAVSTATLYTSNTSNWARGALQDWSTPVSSVALYASNTSNWASNIQQNWSSAVSTATLYTSNTSNWSRNLLQDYSTGTSSVFSYSRNLLQDYSTPVSTVSTAAGQSSNWSRNLLQDYSTGTSSVFSYSRNLLQDFSTPISTVSTTAGQTSNWSRNLLQDYSTGTSSVFSYSRNLLQDYSTPVSTVSTAAGLTSNWSRGLLVDFSTPVSSVSTYTGATSNWSRGILQDWSTPVNTVSLFTMNTSNWARATLQDWSTPVSTVGLYTSNTSNYYAPLLSNNYSTNLQSTVQGLGFAGYISAAQLYSTVTGIGQGFTGSTNILSANIVNISSLSTQYITATQGFISSLVVNSLAIGSNSGFISMGDIITTSHSTLQINTGLLTASGTICAPQIIVSTINGQTFGAPIQSTVVGLATAGYISTATFLSSMIGLTSNISSMIDPTELASSIVGLGTVGFTSSIGLAAIMNSTVTGINTYVSSMIDPVELTSTITGIGTQGFISSVGLDARLASTTAGLGTATYISATQLYSTVAGITFGGSTTGLSAGTIGVSTINMMYLSSVQGYISSLRTDSLVVGGPAGYVTIQDLTTGTVSTGQIVAGAGFISSLQINSLSFGPSGYVIVSNILAASLSTQKLNAQNVYTNNLYVGNNSTQSMILFPGIDGAYKGTAIGEQATGVGTEELLLYKVSTTTDQIRAQTTGNIVFEAGVSARSWPSTQMVATATMIIQGSSSNVGIGTNTPATTLDVAGTGRFQIVSSYALNVSSINGINPGPILNGSTIGLSTAAVFTSSVAATQITTSNLLVTNGTETVVYNGGTATSAYGTGVDTVSIKSALAAYNGGVASLFFGNGTLSYPLARIAAVDTAAASPANSALIFQTTTAAGNAGNTGVYTYNYSNSSYYSFTVPTGVTSISLTMWGAGGAGADGGDTGGGAAYVKGTLAVTPGQILLITVGQGGSRPSSSWGGGGAAGGNGSGGGGGRSAIGYNAVLTVTNAVNSPTGYFTYTTSAPHGLLAGAPVSVSGIATAGYNIGGLIGSVTPTTFTLATATTGLGSLSGQTGILYVELVDAAGGGGAGNSGGPFYGGQGGIVAGAAGQSSTSSGNWPPGGTQTAGGGGTSYTANAGSIFTGGAGGNGGNPGGGGGGGLFGGAGGTGGSPGIAAGGGGSSYVSNLTSATTLPVTAGIVQTAVGTGDSFYQTGIGAGGGQGLQGGNGLVVIQAAVTFTMTEAMRISQYGYLGVGTAAPSTLLDVAGTARAQNMSTLNISLSTINGQTFGAPIQSTVVGLATAGYVSTSQLISSQNFLLGVISTGLSSISTYTGTTSNYAKNILQDWSTPLLSTTAGLGSIGYVSSSQLLSTQSLILGIVSTGLSSVALFTSNTSNYFKVAAGQDISTPISTLSTTYGYALTSLSASISTLTLKNFTAVQGSISSLQVNSLLIGTGTGSINLGDTVMTAISSVSTATNTLYALNTLLGNVSSQTAIQFYGLTGQFNGTVVAEKLVSPGVQELLLYKASSIQDQIRLQTTGNIVFETGVAARSWSTSTAAPTPTLYISYLSNVGIGTAAPATTLDVAGTGRFQNVSTLNITVSTLNGQTFGAPIQSTVVGLGLVGYVSSGQLLSTQALILGITSSGLSSVALFTSNTSNWSRGLLQDFSTPVSTVAQFTSNTSNWASNIQQNWSTTVSSVALFTSNTSNWSRGLLQDWSTPVSTISTTTGAASNWSRGAFQDWSTPLLSTTAGLGLTGYISTSQLYSTVAGIGSGFTGSTLGLSAGRIYTSSLNASYVTATQGYISSLTVDTLQLGFSNAFFEMGDVIAASLSTLQVNTGVLTATTLTASGVVCTPQIIVSTINGQTFGQPIQSTVVGLGLAGYVSSIGFVSAGLSSVALFTSNTSNWSRGLLQDFSTPTTNTSNFFLPLLSNNYSTNLTSTVIGLGTAGYISSGQFLSSMLGLTSNISSMIDPVELASSIVGLGTVGFTSSIGLTAILNSTVAGVNTYVSSMIDPVELASSITSLGTQGFISSIGFDAKLASTTAGLGTATYISAAQLYSTVAGITFSGSTNTLSAARIFTSSIVAAFVTGTQGYISSLVVDSLAIGSNSGFINMGDIITTSHSTLQINTGLFTASGTVCTPQIIVSTINGQTFGAPIQSTVVGLGLAGYISSIGFVSSGLSSVATFTSNTSNYFLPALSNNYSTNLTSTFQGLATGGYISSSQLFSTVAALTGSTLSLSAGSILVSSLQALKISTAQMTVCTMTFNDQTAGNPLGNVYQYSSVLYYNSFVVAGTTAMNIQSFTF